MTHPLKEYVDRIYIVTCSRYCKSRANVLLSTLNRLGLGDITDVIVQTCSPVDMLVKRHIKPVNDGAAQDWVVDLFLGHYRAVGAGYGTGAKRILILEDDACLLDDQDVIRRHLDELRAIDPPVVSLDYGISLQEYKDGVAACPLSLWGCHSGVSFNGTHGYILNREGMRRWLDYSERMISDEDKAPFDVADRMWPNLLTGQEKLLFPTIPLVIQFSPETPGVSSSYWGQHYKEHGVCVSSYLPQRAPTAVLPVVYASDGNDRERLEMSIFSVRKNLYSGAKIFVLTKSNVFDNMPDVTVVNPEPVLAESGFHSRGWNRKWPFATLYRMALPLLPELAVYDRALYLDTDVLCRSNEGNTFITMDLDRYEVYAVFDHESKQYRTNSVISNDLPPDVAFTMRHRLWVPRGTRALTYANAGVALWNLRAIRNNGLDWYRIRLAWFWDAECKGKFAMLDQDFMNVMMDINPSISKRFNWFGGDAQTDCVFQHFAGGSKTSMPKVARELGWMPR